LIKAFTRRNGITEEINLKKGILIRVVNPTHEEIRKLVEFLGVAEDFLLDPLDEEERARIEIDEDKVLIIFKVPVKTREERLPYKTTSIGTIIMPDRVVMISKGDIPLIDERIRMGTFNIKKRSRMLFQMMNIVANEFLRLLKEIHREIDEIEEELHESLRNHEIEMLMNLEKSLVYFVTSLRSNEIVLQRLMKGNVIPIYEEDRDILEDAMVDNRQALETASIYSDILSGMMDAYASIISNNLNIVMKVLAVVTIVMEIPTVITSFYGMNVFLPFQRNPNTYFYVILWSAISIFLLIWWFKKKRWI
jgi:magnesium transporter